MTVPDFPFGSIPSCNATYIYIAGYCAVKGYIADFPLILPGNATYIFLLPGWAYSSIYRQIFSMP